MVGGGAHWVGQQHLGSVGARTNPSRQHLNMGVTGVTSLALSDKMPGGGIYNDNPLTQVNNPLFNFFGMATKPLQANPYNTFEEDILDATNAYVGECKQMSAVMITKMNNTLAWPVTEIMPWKLAPGLKFVRTGWIFCDEYMGETPEQGVSRVIRNYETSAEETLKRKGLAFMMEHGFWGTEKGETCFWLNIEQISNAVIEMYCFNILFELANARLPAEMTAQRGDSSQRLRDKLSENLAYFAILQKDPNGLAMLLRKMQAAMRQQASRTGNILILPEGAKFSLGQARLELMGVTAGEKMRMDEHFGSSTVAIRESRLFTVGERNKRDPLEETRVWGEVTWMTNKHISARGLEYKTSFKDTRIWNHNIDNYTHMKYVDLLGYTGMFEGWNGRRNRSDKKRAADGAIKGVSLLDLQNREYYLKGNNLQPQQQQQDAIQGRARIGNKPSFDSVKPRSYDPYDADDVKSASEMRLTDMGKRILLSKYDNWWHLCHRTGVAQEILNGLSEPKKISDSLYKQFFAMVFESEALEARQGSESVKQATREVLSSVRQAVPAIKELLQRHDDAVSRNDETQSRDTASQLSDLTVDLERKHDELSSIGDQNSAKELIKLFIVALINAGLPPRANDRELRQKRRFKTKDVEKSLSDLSSVASFQSFDSNDSGAASLYKRDNPPALASVYRQGTRGESPYSFLHENDRTNIRPGDPFAVRNRPSSPTRRALMQPDEKEREMKLPTYEELKASYQNVQSYMVHTPRSEVLLQVAGFCINSLENRYNEAPSLALSVQEVLANINNLARDTSKPFFFLDRANLTKWWQDDVTKLSQKLSYTDKSEALKLLGTGHMYPLLAHPKFFLMQNAVEDTKELFVSAEPESVVTVQQRYHVYCYCSDSQLVIPAKRELYYVARLPVFMTVMNQIASWLLLRWAKGGHLDFQTYLNIRYFLQQESKASGDDLVGQWFSNPICSIQISMKSADDEITKLILDIRDSNYIVDTPDYREKEQEWAARLVHSMNPALKTDIANWSRLVTTATDPSLILTHIGQSSKEALEFYDQYYKNIPTSVFDPTGSNRGDIIKVLEAEKKDALTEAKALKVDNPDVLYNNMWPTLIRLGECITSNQCRAKAQEWGLDLTTYRWMLHFMDLVVLQQDVARAQHPLTNAVNYRYIIKYLLDIVIHYLIIKDSVVVGEPTKTAKLLIETLTAEAKRVNADKAKYVPPSMKLDEFKELAKLFYDFIVRVKQTINSEWNIHTDLKNTHLTSPAGFSIQTDATTGANTVKHKTVYQRVVEGERLSLAELDQLLWDHTPFESYAFFRFLVLNDLPDPLGIILHRPNIRVKSYKAILTVDGGEVGHSYYIMPKFEISNSAMVMTMYGHYTLYGRAILERPELVVVMPDAYSTEYISGYDTTVYNAGDPMDWELHMERPYTKSIFAMITEGDWEPKDFYHDMTGRELDHEATMRGLDLDNDLNMDSLTYFSAKHYNALWQFEQHNGFMEFESHKQKFNTLCFPGYIQQQDHTGWLKPINDVGPFQGYIRPGFAAELRKGGPLKQIDYNDSQPHRYTF